MQKYDLFVSAMKMSCPVHNQEIEEPSLIIQQAYREHLHRLGFLDIDYNVSRKVDVRPLTGAEIANLNRQPFYISEHFMNLKISMDEMYLDDTRFTTRPSIANYRYAHGGKATQNHWIVAGPIASGKSCLVHELQKVIHSMVPNAEIIVCESDFTSMCNYDITSNEDEYRSYRDAVTTKKILIGSGPTIRRNADGSLEDNVNL